MEMCQATIGRKVDLSIKKSALQQFCYSESKFKNVFLQVISPDQTKFFP